MGVQDYAKHQALGGNCFPSMRPQFYLNNTQQLQQQQMLQIIPKNAAGSSSLQPLGRVNNLDNIK
jgi:hypothetical protein